MTILEKLNIFLTIEEQTLCKQINNIYPLDNNDIDFMIDINDGELRSKIAYGLSKIYNDLERYDLFVTEDSVRFVLNMQHKIRTKYPKKNIYSEVESIIDTSIETINSDDYSIESRMLFLTIVFRFTDFWEKKYFEKATVIEKQLPITHKLYYVFGQYTKKEIKSFPISTKILLALLVSSPENDSINLINKTNYDLTDLLEVYTNFEKYMLCKYIKIDNDIQYKLFKGLAKLLVKLFHIKNNYEKYPLPKVFVDTYAETSKVIKLNNQSVIYKILAKHF